MSAAAEANAASGTPRGRAYETARNLIGRSIGGFTSYGELETTYDPAGKRILDYDCGRGDDAPRLVQGAPPTSPASISPTLRSRTPSRRRARRA